MVQTRRQRNTTAQRTQINNSISDTVIKTELDHNESRSTQPCKINGSGHPRIEKAYRLDRICIPVSKRILQLDASSNNNSDNNMKKKRNRGPKKVIQTTNTLYSPEQIKNLIFYIMEDKMPIKNASRRARIDEETARKYYRRYRGSKDRVIPQPDLRLNRNKKLYDVHTEFITNLYAQNRDLTNKEVLNTINAAFPDLNLSLSTLLTHIHTKMKDVYKRTATGMGEHSSKLKEHHTQFIADQLRKDPGLSLVKIRLMLQDAYPGLIIDPTTLSRHVHIHLEDLYQDTVSAQQNHRRKIFVQHTEFVEELYKDNSGISRMEVYDELMDTFPDLKKNQVTPASLHLHLKKALGSWYVEHTRIKCANPRKLFPEHVKFITDLFKKNPELSVPKGIVAIQKNFPGFTLGKTTLHRYLKTKCGVEDLSIARRKKRRNE